MTIPEKFQISASPSRQEVPASFRAKPQGLHSFGGSHALRSREALREELREHVQVKNHQSILSFGEKTHITSYITRQRAE